MSQEANETGKKRVEVITSILLIAFAAAVIVMSWDLKITVRRAPGPGMFPLGLGCLIAMLSASILIENLNPKTPDKASKFTNKEGVAKILLLMGGIVAYALLLVPLGYLISTFGLVAYIMIIQRSKPKTTILTAAGITLLLFLIFQVGLRVMLPKSPFGF